MSCDFCNNFLDNYPRLAPFKCGGRCHFCGDEDGHFPPSNVTCIGCEKIYDAITYACTKCVNSDIDDYYCQVCKGCVCAYHHDGHDSWGDLVCQIHSDTAIELLGQKEVLKKENIRLEKEIVKIKVENANMKKLLDLHMNFKPDGEGMKKCKEHFNKIKE